MPGSKIHLSKRDDLTRAALQDAVVMMIRCGQTAEEIRGRRLQHTWELLLELDPTIDDDMGHAADAALAIPRIRPADNTSPITSPYLAVLHELLKTPGSAESTALVNFMRTLVDPSPFTKSVRECRERCGPVMQKMIFKALDHYVVNGIDSELKEVVSILDSQFPRAESKAVQHD